MAVRFGVSALEMGLQRGQGLGAQFSWSLELKQWGWPLLVLPGSLVLSR